MNKKVRTLCGMGNGNNEGLVLILRDASRKMGRTKNKNGMETSAIVKKGISD